MAVNAAAAAAGAADFSDDESSYEVDAEMGQMTKFYLLLCACCACVLILCCLGARFWALPHSIASTT